ERYFEILADTFLGFYLPAFHRSVRKQQRKAPKFYFFDTGVLRAIENTLDVPLRAQTSAFGRMFEHFIVQQIIRENDYRSANYRFSYLRTKDDVEVDLVIERPGKKTLLVEIKSAVQVRSGDLQGFRRLSKDFANSRSIVLCRAQRAALQNGIAVLPW